MGTGYITTHSFYREEKLQDWKSQRDLRLLIASVASERARMLCEKKLCNLFPVISFHLMFANAFYSHDIILCVFPSIVAMQMNH